MLVNGLTAARGLRSALERTGGTMRISVAALGDVFGRGRMTGRARAGIERVLERARIRVRPPLAEAGDGWVTLTLAEAGGPPATGAMPPPEQGAELLASAARRIPIRLGRPATAAVAAVGLLLIALALVSEPSTQTGPVSQTSSSRSQPPAPATRAQQAAARERALAALLAADYRTAVRLTAQVDPDGVRALRAMISGALMTQARAAQAEGAHVLAIRTARRAARYGPAPGAADLVRRSRAGLDDRRERQRAAQAAAAAG